MKARRIARASIALALIVTGCSVVNDPGRHRGGLDGGAATDAGATDATPGLDAPIATDAGPAPIDAVDFCDRLIETYCRARLQCCAAAAGESMLDCVVANDTACEDILRPYLLDRRNAYSPARAGVELAELEGYFANGECDPDIVDWVAGDEGLLAILRGTFPTGTGCGSFEEALACERPEVCAKIGFVQWQCQLRGGSGATCWDNAGCPQTEYCVTAGAEGTCAPTLGNGELCTDAGQCTSRLCEGEPTKSCQERTSEVYCTEPFAPFRR